ncbi:MAG: helix-turn-helix domain-containing protein [Anaerolineaceae bacterium]|nr:helix-turn-helix domain-containing protein [Anaerolineaceae bacterium]
MTYDFSIIRHIRKKMGLTIYGLSEKCNVSYVALSKLERNLGNPELKTLDKIARALDLQTHNLLALAEHDRPKIVQAESFVDEHGFNLNQVKYGRLRISYITGSAGTAGTAVHEHQDDYEICFVLSGKVQLHVRNSVYPARRSASTAFSNIAMRSSKTRWPYTSWSPSGPDCPGTLRPQGLRALRFQASDFFPPKV